MQAKKDAPAHQGNSLRKSNHLRVIVARAAKAASPGLTAAFGKGLAPSALRPCNSIRATAAPRESPPPRQRSTRGAARRVPHTVNRLGFATQCAIRRCETLNCQVFFAVFEAPVIRMGHESEIALLQENPCQRRGTDTCACRENQRRRGHEAVAPHGRLVHDGR